MEICVAKHSVGGFASDYESSIERVGRFPGRLNRAEMKAFSVLFAGRALGN
jgi:hypothetical protein